MSDETQGKATQKDPDSGGNAKAVDKGEATAAARTARPTRGAPRTAAPATAPAASAAAPGTAEDKRPTAEKIADREPKTYRATERGYVDGKIVEPGELFVTKADKGMWMEPVKKGEGSKYSVDMAVEEAQYGKKADVDYEGMSEPGLEALAALLGVTKPGELGKADLITAIKAARIPVAQ